MKKQWISVKCGLSRDPKHRQAMGESIWLFLHMLDRADWESGKVTEWKDEAEADEMSMPIRTLREHRRKLEELDYISCTQKQYGQEITIHNWTNPREYSGVVTNKKQGGKETSPQETEQGYIQGDTQGYIQGSRKDVTPTSNSKNQTSLKGRPDFSELNPGQYRTIPEIKTFIDATGWVPGSFVLDVVYDFVSAGLTKEKIKAAFVEWNARGYKPANVKGYLTWARDGIPAAYGKAQEETGAKPAINTTAIENTKQLLEEKFTGKFVPRPDNVNLRKRAEAAISSAADIAQSLLGASERITE